MKSTVDSFIKEISKIRGGALCKSLFDEIRVDYYGSEVPLNQVCNINMNESSTIVITPYDQTVADNIVKLVAVEDKSVVTPSPSNVDIPDDTPVITTLLLVEYIP